jgi:hypothetical protein
MSQPNNLRRYHITALVYNLRRAHRCQCQNAFNTFEVPAHVRG